MIAMNEEYFDEIRISERNDGIAAGFRMAMKQYEEIGEIKGGFLHWMRCQKRKYERIAEYHSDLAEYIQDPEHFARPRNPENEPENARPVGEIIVCDGCAH